LVYADHASSRQSGSTVSFDDVQLAIQSRVNYSFTQPPPKEVRIEMVRIFFLILKMLLSLASSLNSVPLPPVSNRYGIRLPAPEHCLTNVNFSIVPDPPPDVQFGHSFVRPSTGPQESRQDGVPSGAGDTPMADGDENESHGVKRVLEEDEDYD